MATIRSEDSVWSYHENSSAALTDTVVQAAPGLGLSIYITDIIFSVSVVTAFSLLLEAGTTTTILGPSIPRQSERTRSVFTRRRKSRRIPR